MSKNALALLVAGALILSSAAAVIYISTERAAATKQVTMTSGELMTERAGTRPSASVYGLPAQITPISIRK